jgi:hypothetical protein
LAGSVELKETDRSSSFVGKLGRNFGYAPEYPFLENGESKAYPFVSYKELRQL